MGLGTPYDRWKNKSHSEIPPVILATGPEAQLKQEFLEDLKAEFTAEDRAVDRLYADETAPDKLAGELRSPGLFSASRWIVLKHLQHSQHSQTQLARHWETITDFVEDPDPETTLILVDSDHPYKKGRKLGSLANKVEAAGGWVIIFWEPFEKALRERVNNQLREADTKIDAAALQRLLEKTKGKLARVDMEVEKLAQLELERIDQGTVESVISEETAADIYQDLKDQLVGRDVDTVLHTVNNLLREGEAGFKIFSIIFSYLCKVRSLKRKVRTGSTLKEALDEMNIPTSKGIVKQYRKALKKITDSYPRDFFRASYSTAAKIKYSPDATGRLALEGFLVDLLPRLRSY